MNEYKKQIFIKWWNDSHESKITDEDVWIEGNYLKDYSNGTYDVLSTNDIDLLIENTVNNYASELEEQLTWVLKQNNLEDYAKYIKIDTKLLHDEFSQWDVKMLTGCKDWLTQEYPFEGECYDIIQV